MARMWALLGALALSLLGGGVALGATSLIVADPAVDAHRSADESLTVAVAASNPTGSMSIVSIVIDNPRCTATGSPVLEPMSSEEVHFDIPDCATQLGSLTATLTATLVDSTGQESTAGPVPLTLTVKDPATKDWSALLWFLVGIAALLAVVPPYLTWLAFPQGNARPLARFHWADARSIIGRLGSRDAVTHLAYDLPGISSDWSFKDTWASNVGLAASIFTGIFAAAGPLGGLVGEEGKSMLAVLAVAAAMSAALIGSGPLWLSIFKQRTHANRGYAADNTVAGVLVASFVVYFATFGLIATTVHLTSGMVPATLVGVLATGSLLLLVAYAWKSIPQTLALGRREPGAETVWVVQQGVPPDQLAVIRKMALPVPNRDQPGVTGGTVPQALRPVRESAGPSAMP